MRTAVIGGGNAGLCAAIASLENGHETFLFESAPKESRGGNTKYTRDIRYAHDSDGYASGIYSEEELFSDLEQVSGTLYDPSMARMVIEKSMDIPWWMESHGIVFKREIKGSLNLSRTNIFFLGGGKKLVDTYHRSIERLGGHVLYNSAVSGFTIKNSRIFNMSVDVSGRLETMEFDRYIICSGGFEANRDWLRTYWGDAAGRIVVRGTRYNTGAPLKSLLENGALPVGSEKGGHMVAVDGRSPEYDGGIVTRIDAIPWSIVVNGGGKRFYDEGEDIWPKRYAIWGRLVSEQDGQVAFVITDRKTVGRYMPTAFPPIQANSLQDLAKLINVEDEEFMRTVSEFNRNIVETGDADAFNYRTQNIVPPKSHWALKIDTPPFMAYPVVPGLTFTYRGIKVDRDSKIITQDGPLENGFAAGEIASGNVLVSGYLAGFGLTIGTVLGRIAGYYD